MISLIEPKAKFHIGQVSKKIPIQGPQIISTILKAKGFKTEIHSEHQRPLPLNKIINHSSIIFISINIYNSIRGYEIARRIKEVKNIPIVFGGLHAILFPDEAINFGDYVIKGEAEETIVPILENIKYRTPEKSLGLVYKKNGKVFHTPDAAPPNNINVLPDYAAVQGYKKTINNRFDHFALLSASRGCPYTCQYCGIIKGFGNKVRYKDADFVVKELKAVLDFHRKWWLRKPFINVVWFTDDYFFADRQKAGEILTAIIKSGIRTNIVMQSRVEIGKDLEMLKLFKEAGGYRLYLGIENPSRACLEDYHKKLDVDIMTESINNIQLHDIEVFGLFMYGGDKYYPGTGEKIARFAIENNIAGLLLQAVYPIPSTEFFSNNKNKNRIFTYDWSYYRGLVVFFSKYIKPSVLQREMIETSVLFYSVKRLFSTFGKYKLPYMFPGEWWWHVKERKDMENWAVKLEEIEAPYYDKEGILIEENLRNMKPFIPDILKPYSHLYLNKKEEMKRETVSVY
ncbi:MAG: B12-binding domain-containing radical SAM protein [Candidatus Brocadiaceae bacterium]|nr:B12-binding domain-containing radical SAM protein [Candidatus Brocadiaceae bacterium]